MPSRSLPSRPGRSQVLGFGLCGLLSAACALNGAGEPPAVELIYSEPKSGAAGALDLALATQITLPDNWVLLPDERAGVAVDPVDGSLYVGGRDANFLALDPANGEVRWELELPGSMGSTPVIHERRLLLGTEDGALVAIDLDARAIEWIYETEGVIRNPPIVGDQVVYFTNSRDQVFGLDLRDGSWRWQYEREFPKDFTISGRAGLVWLPADDPEAIEAGVVFTGFDDGRVAAIGATSGEALWVSNLSPRDVLQSNVFADIDSTPLVDLERGELVVVGVSSGVHGLSLADGSLQWRQPFKGGGSAARASDGSYIVASPVGGLVAVRPGGGIKWRTELDPGQYGRPLVVGDTIYLTNSDTGLALYDALRGEHLGSLDNGSGMSSQAVYDLESRRLYALTNRGVLYGFRVSEAGGASAEASRASIDGESSM